MRFFLIHNYCLFLFFIGAGISNIAGLPSGNDIAQKMSEELELHNNHQNLSELAEYYEAVHGRNELISFLQKVLAEEQIIEKPDNIYDLINRIPVNIILTTNYDNLLQKMSNEMIVINRNVDLWRIKESYRNIIKIHGDFDAPMK